MSIDTLKKEVKQALEHLLKIQALHAQSAHKLHEVDRTLRLRYIHAGKKT